MHPPLPPSRRAQAGRSVGRGVLLWTAVLAASSASALDLTLSTPRERNGYVYVDARVADPFVPRVEESLARGMPATLEVQSELWRRRNGWFDRLESSFRASVRVRYEVWGNHYRIERAGAEPLRVTSIDSVAALLSRPWALPAARIGQLVPGPRYYVVVHAVLKPLTVEDVQEVEGWLSGEVKTHGRAGIGVITELPRALFDTVRNFAGFGDRRTRAVSPEFELRDLFAAGGPKSVSER